MRKAASLFLLLSCLLLPVLCGGESAADSAPEETVVLSLVGDCSVGDAFETDGVASSYHSVVDREGYAWPFSLVYGYLSADDLTVANLEVVLTEQKKHKDIRHPLRADPDHVNVLLEGSVEVVNTVNNHCMDFRRQGYLDSLAVLDTTGVRRFGTVNFQKEDGFDDLLVVEVKGVAIGFVGFTYPHEPEIKACEERIRILKEEKGCDLVIVSMHWGREGHLTPQNGQVETGKRLIDSGADVIYGHHPHVLQPMVLYKDKPIFCSVGNFTFGTMSDVDNHTGIFQLTYRRSGGKVLLSRVRVVPCRTAGSNDYRPRELEDPEQREKVFSILTSKKRWKDCVNMPASFRSTGILDFDESGHLIVEE